MTTIVDGNPIVINIFWPDNREIWIRRWGTHSPNSLFKFSRINKQDKARKYDTVGQSVGIPSWP